MESLLLLMLLALCGALYYCRVITGIIETVVIMLLVEESVWMASSRVVVNSACVRM